MIEMEAPEREQIQEAKEVRDLVEKCKAHDPVALKAFFDRFAEDIFNFPLKVFHLDEDAASDFFLYAFERLRDGNRFKSFQGRSSFRTWFYTVLRNLVIDWMRTIREIQTVNFSRIDDKGNELRQIENTADPKTVLGFEDATTDELRNKISELGADLKLVLKLSFIYYLDLDKDDIQLLSTKTGKSVPAIHDRIAKLKHSLSESELKNIASEDKITSLYVSIQNLKNKREKLIQNAKNVYSASVADQLMIEKIEKSIEKKYNQRRKLLEKKEKGHFVVRTPYKVMAEILSIPEGSVSVQMMRALDRLRGKSGIAQS